MSKRILLDLGNRIRFLRQQVGLSQEELGNIANLHRTYIGAIERGERNPSVLSLEKIADALNTSIRELFHE